MCDIVARPFVAKWYMAEEQDQKSPSQLGIKCNKSKSSSSASALLGNALTMALFPPVSTFLREAFDATDATSP